MGIAKCCACGFGMMDCSGRFVTNDRGRVNFFPLSFHPLRIKGWGPEPWFSSELVARGDWPKRGVFSESGAVEADPKYIIGGVPGNRKKPACPSSEGQVATPVSKALKHVDKAGIGVCVRQSCVKNVLDAFQKTSRFYASIPLES